MSDSTPPSGNRRLSVRRPPKGRIRITCRLGGLDLGPNVAVSVLDLSETGVRVLVRRPLEPGREVSVGLEAQAQPRPIVRAGRVVWSVPTADGAFCLGVAFDKRLPYREYLELSREPPATR